jgi:biotin-dependent carboxylase-like uncharacterized protein
MTHLVVVDPGWATSIQDGGRPGLARLGVPPSGALDEPQRQLLNRVVGNREDAAVLETLGRLRLRATGPMLIATSSEHAATSVRADATIEVEPAPGDLWGYLAVRGGIAAESVLGSRSTDSRSGLGPPSVMAGTTLPIGPDPGTPVVVDQAPRPSRDQPVIAVWRGPRADWFTDEAFAVLAASPSTVSGEASRVGVRLDGPVLARRVTGELASEGLITGAVQVPPDGRPVVMLNDHPTTGGYPVLAVVDPGSLPAFAQSRPGSTVRFRVLQ